MLNQFIQGWEVFVRSYPEIYFSVLVLIAIFLIGLLVHRIRDLGAEYELSPERFGFREPDPEQMAQLEVELRLLLEGNLLDKQAYTNLAYVLFLQGRLEEAEEKAKQSLLIDAEYAAAHYVLGRICEQQNRPVEAKQQFGLARSAGK